MQGLFKDGSKIPRVWHSISGAGTQHVGGRGLDPPCHVPGCLPGLNRQEPLRGWKQDGQQPLTPQCQLPPRPATVSQGSAPKAPEAFQKTHNHILSQPATKAPLKYFLVNRKERKSVFCPKLVIFFSLPPQMLLFTPCRF